MAKAPDLTFTLSLAAVQAIRQVGERLERLDSLLEMVGFLRMELSQELEALQEITYMMEKQRGASGPDDVRVGGSAPDPSGPVSRPGAEPR